MKLHRFIDNFDLKQKEITITQFEIVHQLTHVLRIKKGDHLILCNGEGSEAEVEIVDVGKTELHAKVCQLHTSIVEPRHQVTLYAAIIKGEHFELLAEKAVEVGVHRIVPIITARTVKLNLKLDRIQKIMKEAAEQSGRGRVPVIDEPLSFKEALQESKENDKNFFCDFSSTFYSSALVSDVVKIGCFVGPEGGWDDKERELATQELLVPMSLGNFVFRAETAGIIVSYLFCQE